MVVVVMEVVGGEREKEKEKEKEKKKNTGDKC